MTVDDLTRMAAGDEDGTYRESFENSQCDAAQRAADRGQLMVPVAGNVFMMTLPAGRYAILIGGPESETGLPSPMAVLDVLP